LLQPHQIFAVGGEPEMPGLDDAGMHRANRDLMQSLAFVCQELVGRGGGCCACTGGAKRPGLIPRAVIEPWPRIGATGGLQPKQVPDCPLKAPRRRMPCSDARECSR